MWNAGVQQGVCDGLSQYEPLEGFHDHRDQGDRFVVIQSCDGCLLGDRYYCEVGGYSAQLQ